MATQTLQQLQDQMATMQAQLLRLTDRIEEAIAAQPPPPPVAPLTVTEPLAMTEQRAARSSSYMPMISP